jgi:hypothetical protein
MEHLVFSVTDGKLNKPETLNGGAWQPQYSVYQAVLGNCCMLSAMQP